MALRSTSRSSFRSSAAPASDAPASTAPARRRRRRWYHYLLLKIVLLALIVAVVGSVATTPWAFHIGGGVTPLARWDGYGPVRASDGGRYELLVRMQAGLFIFGGPGTQRCSQLRHCDTVRGTAQLCTGTGRTFTFQVTGEVHAYASTDGARTSLRVAGGSPRALPDVITFRGAWRGGTLRLTNADSEFTRAFTASGMLRKYLYVADKGTAAATLRSGSPTGFTAACRALAT
jgi:nitrate reductase NapE component